MKKSVIFLFCFIFYTYTSAQEIKFDSYDINVKLENNSEFIIVTSLVRFHTERDLKETYFTFSTKADLKKAECYIGTQKNEVNLTQMDNDSLHVVFGDSIWADNDYILGLEYTFPADIKNDTLLLIDRGHRWYPIIPEQIVPFELTCEVPREYGVLAAGNMVFVDENGNTDIYKYESKIPVFKLPLIIYNKDVFKKNELQKNYINICLYSLEDDSVSTNKILEEADSALNYYSAIIGEYPFKSLNLFEVNLWDGMNIGSGIISVGSRSLNMMRKGYLDGLYLTIAEQWMGAGVFAHYGQPGFWFFALSLPHYLRLMYLRETKGEEYFLKELNQPLDKYKEFAGKENDVPVMEVDKPNSMEKSLVLYAKGPYVLYKLNEKMGNEKWILFLRNLYSRFRGKVIDYDLFIDLLSEYDKSGEAVVLLNKLVTQIGL